MNYYATTYSYPNNINGLIERSRTVYGYTDLHSPRIHNMPSNNAIEFYKGDDKMIRVFVKDENMDIINLNGAEARFYLSYNSKSETYIFRKTTADYTQGIIRTPEKGEIVFFINSIDTVNLPTDQYFYQVIVTLSNGNRYTVVSANMNLRSNLEYTTAEPDDTTHEAIEISIPANSAFIRFAIRANEAIIPVLIAPDGSAEQIWITNLVYETTFVSVYFSADILGEGWKLSYISNPL